jgi:Ca2+-binding EF-hand superfamily protein
MKTTIARTIVLTTAFAFGLPLAAQAQMSGQPQQQLQPAQTPQERMTPDGAFKRADTNGDGRLNKEEAARMPAISARFAELDKDKDGALSMAEFMAAFEMTAKQ